MQTANPRGIADRQLSPFSAVLGFMLIIYKDYNNLKNNFLLSLEIVPSVKTPKTMLQRQEFFDFLLCQMVASVPTPIY